jgi:protein-tyrosine phosphatase
MDLRMIDLHSHVLPGLDDGPAEIEESLELVRAAAAQGTTVLAATPHLRDDYPEIQLETLSEACAALNERVPAGVDLRVVPGGEVDVFWAQHATDEQLRLASFEQRGTDLLLETPYGSLPGNFEELLFRITVRGYRILLAHPERNQSFQRDMDRLREMVSRGVLVQITLPSVLAGDRGSRSHKLALQLVREGLAHNLASDSHSPSPRFRPPDLRRGVRELAEVAPGYAEWMVTDAPAAILAGEPLPPPPRAEAPRRGIRRPSWLGG